MTRKIISRRRYPNRADIMRGLRPNESVRGPAKRVKTIPGALCSMPLYAWISLTYFWVSVCKLKVLTCSDNYPIYT